MIRTDGSAVFHRSLDLAYPSIERGEGVWLTTADGRRILDACSGGAMVACLGHGVAEIAAAAAEQAERSRTSTTTTSRASRRNGSPTASWGSCPGWPGCGSSPAGPRRTRRRCSSRGCITSNAATPTAGARSRPRRRTTAPRWGPRADRTHGGPGAVHPVPRLPPAHPAVDLADRPDRGGRPRRARPPARAARPRDRGVRLRTRDRGRPPRLLPARTLLAGPRRTPAGARVPDLLRRGRHRDRPRRELAAATSCPIEPDIVAVGKGLGAGYAPLAGVLVREEVYEAIDRGSREFDLGHTWDGAPLPVGRRSRGARPDRRAPGSSTGSANAGRPCATSSPRRSRVRGSSRRSAGVGSSWVSSSSTRATACRSCPSSSTPRGCVGRHGVRTRTARDLHPPAGGRVRRRPGAPRARLHEHRRGARRDGRAVRATMTEVERRVGAALAGSPS
jgi:Adenosylmethionine-8-amino-7-oxononanoate aminotransferase